MNANHEIASDAGVVVLWDSSDPLDLDEPRDESFARRLHDSASDGRLFFIQSDSEEPVRYRMHFVAGDEPVPESELFEDAGGTFRLELPSGKLMITGIGNKASSQTEQVLDTAAGTYLLNLKARRAFESKEYKSRMVRLHGEADARYARAVDRFGLSGCLMTLAAAACMLIPVLRPHWWKAALIIGVPWATYFILRLLPRYQRIEKASQAAEKRIPHFIVMLKLSPAAREIAGGWVRGI